MLLGYIKKFSSIGYVVLYHTELYGLVWSELSTDLCPSLPAGGAQKGWTITQIKANLSLQLDWAELSNKTIRLGI